MDRVPQHQTGRPRRYTTGVALVAAATLFFIATIHGSFGVSDHDNVQSFPNASGAIGIAGLTTAADNLFFAALGTNGRSCATCHLPAQGWTITPDELRDRFERTDGLDPIDRTRDRRLARVPTGTLIVVTSVGRPWHGLYSASEKPWRFAMAARR